MKKRRRPDFLIFFATVTLLGFGIIMVFSASSVAATTEFGDSFHYLKTQAVATVIGLAGMGAGGSSPGYSLACPSASEKCWR